MVRAGRLLPAQVHRIEISARERVSALGCCMQTVDACHELFRGLFRGVSLVLSTFPSAGRVADKAVHALDVFAMLLQGSLQPSSCWQTWRKGDRFSPLWSTSRSRCTTFLSPTAPMRCSGASL